jgi:hypothetical protein
LLKKASTSSAKPPHLAVWVPAFAGTTAVSFSFYEA